MEAATSERGGLKPVDDREPPSEEAAREEKAETEEQEQASAEATAEVQEQLSMPVGGIRASKARLQITGGSVEVSPNELPDKDDELEVTVTGWIKTVKLTTEGKGGVAVREAIFVVEDVEL